MSLFVSYYEMLIRALLFAEQVSVYTLRMSYVVAAQPSLSQIMSVFWKLHQ